MAEGRRAAPQTAGVITVLVSTQLQLQTAVKTATHGTTIVIAAGTYYLSSTLWFVNRNDITIRGATGNSNDVVLVGRGMSNASYGSVPHGIWSNGQRTTIANLTIRDVYQHAIILNAGAEQPRISNVRLINAGMQFIKSNPDPATGGGVDRGIVENSILEYTTTGRSAYINAVDVHTGVDWIVRRNLFRNIRAPAGPMGGPAVLMWNKSRNSIIEGNTFINCQREISLGLQSVTPDDHTGGIVRSNFIYRSAGLYSDVGILIADSPNTQVLHNTLVLNGTYPRPIEYRFANTTGTVVRHNLLGGGVITARDGATGTVTANHTAATLGMFVNPAAGNLHLNAAATAVMDKVPTLANASVDADGQARPQGAASDYGADEYFVGGALNSPPTVTLTSPVEGAAFTLPAALTLTASASDANGSIARVDFYAGGKLVGSDTASPYAVGWSVPAAGSYSLYAVARDNHGATATSAVIAVSAVAAGALPVPWTSMDVGGPALNGNARYQSGVYTVTAAGTGIAGTADQFHFIYRTLDGDGQMILRVGSLQKLSGLEKAGVMIRAELTGGAPHAFSRISTTGGFAFERRRTTGGTSTTTAGDARLAPCFLKIVRAGSTFTAYSSVDGVQWKVMGSDTIAMPALVYVGAAATSQKAASLIAATFTNLSVIQTGTHQQ